MTTDQMDMIGLIERLGLSVIEFHRSGKTIIDGKTYEVFNMTIASVKPEQVPPTRMQVQA